MSWISSEDLIGAIHHAVMTDSVTGVVNAVAPNPVTSKGFAQALGHVLSRPSIAPLPAFALKAMFGEMAEATILAGAKVMPDALLRSGFQFLHPQLEDALRFTLGR
jgi:NAD dependent epimerase/dehydratase family enzyme